ncbi:MAG: methyl-accepting chemotaxis protein [Oscillospiraceae bacterium]
MKKKTAFHIRLIVGIMIMLTAMIIVIAQCTYFFSRNAMDQRINKEIDATLTSKSLEFDRWIYEQENSLDYYGSSIQYNKLLDTFTRTELEQFLAQKITEYTMDYYVVMPDGTTIFASGFVLPDDFDVLARDWYKATIAAKGEYAISSPYVDNNTKSLCITASRAFYKQDGSLDFVMGVDVYADYLTTIANTVKIFDNAYAILIDNELNIITHENAEYVPYIKDDGTQSTTNLKDIEQYAKLSEMIQGGEQNNMLGRDYDGTSSYFVTKRIESTGWYYIYSAASIEYNNQMRTLIMSMVIVFIISLAAAFGVVTLLVRAIIKPVEELKTAADKMKNGNLSYTPTYYANDSISELCTGIADTNKVWTGYINDINSNLGKLSCGDFSLEFNGEYVGDFAEIKQSILNISDKLKTIIGGIENAARQVSSDSASVAESSNFLAENVSSQSQTIDELTELINRLVTRIEDNAASAETAQSLAGVASGNVSECNSRMTQLMESMNDINAKADEIVKIVKTIDDIAFQTNILALNAAIEAARAGAAGKGFAVVADEVRNLASKSAEAVKNTQELISGTGEAVRTGAQIAADTETALNTVSADVENVNSLIIKISEASEIQAENVKEVSTKIHSIEDAVRSTAATAQESAASGQELNSQSQILQSIVSEFRQK